MNLFLQPIFRIVAMVKRKLYIRMTRNATIAAFLIVLLITPSLAFAAFNPISAIFTGGGGAAAGCVVGAILTIWLAGSGCAIGALAGGLIGAGTGLLGSLGDAAASSIIKAVLGIIRWVSEGIVSLFLTYAAELLQAGIAMNTVSFTDFGPVKQTTALSANIANLLLVAVFIVIGLATILGLESYGMRKNLPLFIIIVLIVNFSPVFVDFAANTGNVFMRFFWENSNLKNTPLSAFILGNMHISNVVSSASSPEVEKVFQSGSLKDASQTSAALGRAGLDLLIIFLGVFASYVIFRMALIFILRIGIFWLLAIIAPLVFAASVLPPMRKHLQEWWQQLFNWAVIGPATFLFLFFGLLIWSELNKSFLLALSNARPGSAPNSAAAFAPFFMFPLVMIFFMVAIKVSKQMAGAIANGIIDGAMKIGKGVALGTLALGAGAALAGVGVGLSRAARSNFVKNASERLQRSRMAGLRGLGQRVGALREHELKKEQERIHSGQEVWDDFTQESDTPAIEARYDGADARTRIKIIKGMLNNSKTLTASMQADAIKYGSTRDPELRRVVRWLYPHQDEDIYQGKDARNPLDFDVLRRKFKAVGSNRHQVNLSGIGDPHDPADWKRSQAFYVLAGTQWNRNNWNALVEDPDPRKLADFRTNLEELRRNILIPAFMRTLVSAGYNEEDVRGRVRRLVQESVNVVSNRSNVARGDGTAAASSAP